MSRVSYSSVFGTLMYVMICTHTDICYVVRLVSRYQSNSGIKHWKAVKRILRHLKDTASYSLCYQGGPILIYCDNQVAIAYAKNLKYCSRIKYIDTTYKFARVIIGKKEYFKYVEIGLLTRTIGSSKLGCDEIKQGDHTVYMIQPS
ncbi:uncharacterized protein LOC111370123 [Olea europaea var. sylvestris]|uniref:uncharacterized protein LOC111370123 n=1 Tax=Olea europaea var. sylvestris TaxID=158386 RepID=UPI000C1D3C3A|nr:uncharacterized protein LOC111370123 [Olea europaea var. sylvestris]